MNSTKGIADWLQGEAYTAAQQLPVGNIQACQGNQTRDFAKQLASLGVMQTRKEPVYSGNKPLVVCGGEINEAKDLDDAQRMAEESAHAKGKNAYILKPIKMVAPKRDVVTTDL